MFRIGYLLPYFGNLPKGFDLWLLTCQANPSMDWLIFTDDQTKYDYPENVKVKYISYDAFKKRIVDHFNFPVVIDRPWKLCEFKPAYGEIFSHELREYDFWGHCDTDLIWGDIRNFITDDILEKYDKIGFQGHSTLYRNTPEVNSRYKTIIPGQLSYKDIFNSSEGHCFDENGIENIYEYLKIPYFRETNFAHLDRFHSSFFLGHQPISEDYKNDRQVFVWNNGKIIRYYLKQKSVCQEEYMYLHFFSAPITYRTTKIDISCKYVARPHVVENLTKEIDVAYLQKYGHCSSLYFYLKVAYFNRHKITAKKILNAFRLKYKRERNRVNSNRATISSKIR